MVVFDDHILIFSDKDCRFGAGPRLELEWARWYRKAVRDSARQVRGAERWIRSFPHRLFLDRNCSIPFPIDLPDPAKAVFHRIIVAHDVSQACQDRIGGSGSLMLDTALIGDAHCSGVPFTIGHVDPQRGYIHVLDDTTLDILMSTLDTISDFVAYLSKKERFLTGSRVIHAAGEEELLAVYLTKMNKSGEHDFVIGRTGDYDVLTFAEGIWERFANSPERRAQAERDRISYAWDRLIEKFAFHAMTGTQYHRSGRPLREQEAAFRLMAREPRTRRRMLAISLHEVLERSVRSSRPWSARVDRPTNPAFPHYVFLFVKPRDELTHAEYRTFRMNLLVGYCKVAKSKFADAKHIVGIATEASLSESRSEDFLHIDASNWSLEDQVEATKLQQEFGILKSTTAELTREWEYPVDHEGKLRAKPPSRNSPCPCGSRKRFKNCHGKEIHSPKRGRHSR